MKQNEEVFNAYIFGESFKAHCQQMENLGEWGTQAEIFAIATLLKINIFVFTWESHSELYHWLCYKPITTHRCVVNKCSSSVKKVWNLTPPANYHIEIIHSFQTHFDRVAPSDLTLTAMENSPCLRDSVDSIEF